MRGNRDDNVNWTDEDPHNNQNNFIELARFRAERDDVLKVLYAHLKNAPKNACYTSKTIQNQMIFIIGNQIRDDILEEVYTSCKIFFSNCR